MQREWLEPLRLNFTETKERQKFILFYHSLKYRSAVLDVYSYFKVGPPL